MRPSDRLSDGAPDATRARRTEAQREAKRIALRARFESGATYLQISQATGRHLAHVYDALNHRNDVRHLTLGDLVSLSRAAEAEPKAFAAYLVAVLSESIKGNEVDPAAPPCVPLAAE